MSTQIPNTDSVVSYAYTVSINGTTVGTLQSFNPTSARILERIREIRADVGNADTKEIVPGRSTFSATLTRFELYEIPLMKALGVSSLQNLANIVDDFEIVEKLSFPDAGKKRIVIYSGCWVENWGKTITEGTVTVSENVTIQVTSIAVSGRGT